MKRRLLSVTSAMALAAAGLAVAGCDLIDPPRSPGEKLWRDNCAKCHGADGSGNTPAYMGNSAADLTDDYWKHGGAPEDIANTIRDGVFGEMPPNKGFSEQDVKLLTKYVLSLHRETGAH